jgi:hypothetical protein
MNNSEVQLACSRFNSSIPACSVKLQIMNQQAVPCKQFRYDLVSSTGEVSSANGMLSLRKCSNHHHYSKASLIAMFVSVCMYY